MAQYEPDAGDATEGALGTPSALPSKPDEGPGGFDYWLFGLLAVVGALVAIQNVWLRRRAQRENAEKGEGS